MPASLLLAPRPPGLLLIEGDADCLRREGHTRAADELEQWLRPRAAEGSLRLTRYPVRSLADVERGSAVSGLLRFDVVVLVGHGSPAGFAAAPSVSLSWDRVAALLAPVQPKAVLAVSCFGGLTGPTDALFRGIPSLQWVLGSPGMISGEQMLLAVIDIAAGLAGAQLPDSLSGALRMLGAMATGAVMWKRTREEFTGSSVGDRLSLDVLGVLLSALLRSVGPHLSPDRANVVTIHARSASANGSAPRPSAARARRRYRVARSAVGPAARESRSSCRPS